MQGKMLIFLGYNSLSSPPLLQATTGSTFILPFHWYLCTFISFLPVQSQCALHTPCSITFLHLHDWMPFTKRQLLFYNNTRALHAINASTQYAKRYATTRNAQYQQATTQHAQRTTRNAPHARNTHARNASAPASTEGTRFKYIF